MVGAVGVGGGVMGSVDGDGAVGGDDGGGVGRGMRSSRGSDRLGSSGARRIASVSLVSVSTASASPAPGATAVTAAVAVAREAGLGRR